jgi:hypothetical protein
MLTRREVLVGAIATGASMRIRTAVAKASEPATPVNLVHISDPYDSPSLFA